MAQSTPLLGLLRGFFASNRRSRASADAQNDSVPSCISQKELKF